MIIGITSSQAAKENTWQYLGLLGSANETINRGSLIKCDNSSSGSLDYLNSNYPASNYSVGYVVQVTSTSGVFPDTILCQSRFFEVV